MKNSYEKSEVSVRLDDDDDEIIIKSTKDTISLCASQVVIPSIKTSFYAGG